MEINQKIETLMKEIREEIMEWKNQRLGKEIEILKMDNERLREKYNEKEMEVEELIERNRKLKIAAENGKKRIKKMKDRKDNDPNNQRKENLVCYKCGKQGHIRKNCRKENSKGIGGIKLPEVITKHTK